MAGAATPHIPLRRVVLGHLPELASRLERVTSTRDFVGVLSDLRGALCLMHAADGNQLDADADVRNLLDRWRGDALDDLARHRSDDLEQALEDLQAVDYLIGACA